MVENSGRNSKGKISDGSKLDNGNTGAAVCWKDKGTNRWREKIVFLGRNKEVLDAELWAILSALEIARDETFNTSNAPIAIFSDSQKDLQEIQHPAAHKNRFLRGQIYHQATILQSTGLKKVLNKLNAGVHLLTSRKPSSSTA